MVLASSPPGARMARVRYQASGIKALVSRLWYQALPRLTAGGLGQAWLHWPCEAASRVRSHISPGPYRSFRELSLARSVDLVTWCPPTFVGNSGIERSNGHRGFALFLFCLPLSCLPPCRHPPSPAKAGDPVRSAP